MNKDTISPNQCDYYNSPAWNELNTPGPFRRSNNSERKKT